MDGLTSHFQGLNPNLAPNIVTALSSEQFLYNLSRTPSPTRFQRPRCNRQTPPGLPHPFQANGIGDGASRDHADVKNAHSSSLMEVANSETCRNSLIFQIAQSSNEEGYAKEVHMRHDFKSDEAMAYFQRLMPKAEMKSTFHDTQASIPTNIRSTNEEFNKTAAKISASGISSTALALPLPMNSSESVDLAASAECNIPCNHGHESGYHW
jgi:hypothetical protein